MLIRHSYQSLTTHTHSDAAQGMMGAAAMDSTETDEGIDHNKHAQRNDVQKGHVAVAQSDNMGESYGDSSRGNVGDNDSGHGLAECSICLIVFEQGSTVITVTHAIITHLATHSYNNNTVSNITHPFVTHPVFIIGIIIIITITITILTILLLLIILIIIIIIIIITQLPDPCGHVFHAACIEHWFQNAHSCPLCKRSIRDIIRTITGDAGGGGGTAGGTAAAATGVNVDGVNVSTTGVALVPSSSSPRNVVTPTVPHTSTSSTSAPAVTASTAIAIHLLSSNNNNNNDNDNNDTLRSIQPQNNQPHAAPMTSTRDNSTSTNQRRGATDTLPASAVAPMTSSTGGSPASWGATFSRSVQRLAAPWRQYQPAGRLEEGEVEHRSPINHIHPGVGAIPSTTAAPGI